MYVGLYILSLKNSNKQDLNLTNANAHATLIL